MDLIAGSAPKIRPDASVRAGAECEEPAIEHRREVQRAVGAEQGGHELTDEGASGTGQRIGERQTEQAARAGQHETLRDQLPDDATARRA